MTEMNSPSSDMSARYNESARTWDSTFSEAALNRYHVAACWRAFQGLAGNCLEGRAVELGVGTGLFTIRLAAKFKSIEAIDFSEEMLKVLQANLDAAGVTNVTCHHGDALNLTGIASGTADVVYCFGLLENIVDAQRVFDEVHRILKPGGTFAGTVSNQACPWYGLRRLLNGDKWYWNEARLYRAEELAEFARRSGFISPAVSGWGLIPSQLPGTRWLAPVALVERALELSPLSRYLGGLVFKFDRT